MSDEFDLNAGHTFRYWSVSTIVGYVTNRGLSEGQRTISRSFGAQVSREFNRRVGAYLVYAYRSQSASNVCASGTCASDGNQQTGGIGIYWHPRGWRLDNLF
jgi:hypothetical protein